MLIIRGELTWSVMKISPKTLSITITVTIIQSINLPVLKEMQCSWQEYASYDSLNAYNSSSIHFSPFFFPSHPTLGIPIEDSIILFTRLFLRRRIQYTVKLCRNVTLQYIQYTKRKNLINNGAARNEEKIL